MVAIGGSEGSRGGVQKAHNRTKEISTSEKEGEVIRSHELINGQEARRDHHLARAGQRGLGRGQRYHRVYGSENASSKGSVCSSFTGIDLHSSLHFSLFTPHSPLFTSISSSHGVSTLIYSSSPNRRRMAILSPDHKGKMMVRRRRSSLFTNKVKNSRSHPLFLICNHASCVNGNYFDSGSVFVSCCMISCEVLFRHFALTVFLTLK